MKISLIENDYLSMECHWNQWMYNAILRHPLPDWLEMVDQHFSIQLSNRW